MLDVLTGFVGELRASGLPISVTESTDAADATVEISLDDRVALRAALGATLVKSPEHIAAFSRVFDLYFSRRSLPGTNADEVWVVGDGLGDEEIFVPGRQGSERKALSPNELRDLVRRALEKGDRAGLSEGARLAVELFGEVEAERPVGVAYYLHKTLRSLDLAGLLKEMLEAVEQGSDPRGVTGDALERTLNAHELTARGETFRELVIDEITRMLVDARGAGVMAKSMRRALVEDLDFMHASADDLLAMRRAIYPLARILAARLARKRRGHRRGPLDVRQTIRRSLSTGGVPLEPQFKHPHPARPEIFVLADVSGSVSSFARFTVHLVYAISEQFSKVRSAVFIDGVDEVTEIFQRASSIADAITQVGEQADVVDAHGHSNYGNALKLFDQRYGATLTRKTNLIILGDARSNYHAGEAEILRSLRKRAHRIFWLNPEPRSYWGTGDSIMGEYAPYCDGVFECRTLRQLKEFVDYLA
jgi:hypothetical protein